MKVYVKLVHFSSFYLELEQDLQSVVQTVRPFWVVIPSLVSKDSGFQILESLRLFPSLKYILFLSMAERRLETHREKKTCLIPDMEVPSLRVKKPF